MRAVVVAEPGPTENLLVKQLPDPVPQDGELTIDVEYAGVGFVDTLFRAGALEFPTPFIPGIEVAGRVRELGPGVVGFEVGQPVAALLNDFGRGPRVGGYAEVAVAHVSMATQLPSDADTARAAATIVNGVTAWLALHTLGQLQKDDDVLVLGASGGLGSIASRLAAIHPARRVIGVVGSDRKRASAPVECTDVVLGSDLVSAVDELTEGRGVDVIVDPVGGELRTLAHEKLAPLGRHLILGNASGQDATLSTDAAWLGSRQVLGLSLGGVAHIMPDQVSDAAAKVMDLLHRGVLEEPAPAILPLDQAADVHRALEERRAPAKTVLAVHTG